MPLTPEQEALKAAALAATPGKWIAQHEYDGDRLTDVDTGNEFSSVLPENGTWPEDVICEVWSGNHLDEPNAKFIAAANPTAILALLAQLEAVQDEPVAGGVTSNMLEFGVKAPETRMDKGFDTDVIDAAQEAPSEPYAPKFDEAEFNAMVEKGTKTWAGVPDNWLEVYRGNEAAQAASSEPEECRACKGGDNCRFPMCRDADEQQQIADGVAADLLDVPVKTGIDQQAGGGSAQKTAETRMDTGLGGGAEIAIDGVSTLPSTPHPGPERQDGDPAK